MHCCLTRISFCFVFFLVWSVSHRRFPSNLGMGGDLFTHGRCAKNVMSNSVYMGGAFDWSTLLEGDQVAIQLLLWRKSPNVSNYWSFLQDCSVFPEESPPVFFLGQGVLNKLDGISPFSPQTLT